MAQQPSQSGKSPGTDCAGSETPKSLVGSTELVCGILANPGDLAAHAARPYNVGDRIEQLPPKHRLGLALSRQCSNRRRCPTAVESLSGFRISLFPDIGSR